MPLSRRRGASDELNPWPGYVDALSTLLMVIIFVLLVFVLAQAFLSVALTGRDRALDRLNRQVAELTEMLSLEHGRAGELQAAMAAQGRDLQAAQAAQGALDRALAGLRAEQNRVAGERDAARSERDRLSTRLADTELQAQSALARSQQLQGRIADTATRTEAAGQEAAALAGQLADGRRRLAQAQAELDARAAAIAQLEEQRAAVQADLDRTVRADKATLEARAADVARLNAQVAALAALRDQLQQQVADAAARATTDEQRRQALAAQLADEKNVGDSARAQIALLNQQFGELRAQMERVSAALRLQEAAGRDKDAQITTLGNRLNAALASTVEELQRYRSEFFAKLSQVLQNRQDVQVVGDRFVFQSEVLFPAGSAELTASGEEQIRKLAVTLKQIAGEIPAGVAWILRVDGHADKQPRARGDAGNWELSAQRAVNVVKLLIAEGIPANHLAATGFGEFQPLDAADTPAAYARNRRIELRLTDR